MDTTASVIKPGWHTTEFWVTVLPSAAAIALSCAGVLPPKYAAIATTAAGGFYSIARGLAKMQPPAAGPILNLSRLDSAISPAPANPTS